MKKIGILNREISRVISGLGHTDQIVVCDAGFPIPSHVEQMDLSLIPGVPSFLATLETVLIELKVERVYYAEEIRSGESDRSTADRQGPCGRRAQDRAAR